MFINYEMATIEITKAESREAGKYGSEMYKNLNNARRENVGFTVVIKEAKRKRDPFKGLTFEKMEFYIEKRSGERKEALMEEFNELRGYINGKRDILAERASYGEIKAWFLEQFPEVTEFNEKLAAKRNDRREAKKNKMLESLIA